MLFQKYKIELTTLHKLATILIDDAFVNYKYYLRYLVIGHKQNFLSWLHYFRPFIWRGLECHRVGVLVF